MNRAGRRHRRTIAEMNVVPYIDVMLVLLVIFMITAPLLAQGVKVELPQSAAQTLKSQDQEPLVVTVDAKGDFYINYGGKPNQPVDPHTLLIRASALMRVHPGIQVLVRGDRQVSYGDVVAAMALLQRAGAPSVGLVTESPTVNDKAR